MTSKKYHVEKPEQLRMLAFYAKETPNLTLRRIARIWQSAINRKVKTRWDNAIFVCFSGDRSSRKAEVMRTTSDNKLVSCTDLRYNLARKWCEENLRQVFD